MTNQTAACLKSTFRDIKDGTLTVGRQHGFGETLQSAIRLGLTTKADAAQVLGVQPSHVYTKTNTLKPAEVKDLCQKLAL